MILFDKEGVAKDCPSEILTVAVEQSMYEGELDVIFTNHVEFDDGTKLETSITLDFDDAKELGEELLKWQERSWIEYGDYPSHLIIDRSRGKYYQTDPWDNSDERMKLVFAKFSDGTPSHLEFEITYWANEEGEEDAYTMLTVALDYASTKELAQKLANLSQKKEDKTPAQ